MINPLTMERVCGGSFTPRAVVLQKSMREVLDEHTWTKDPARGHSVNGSGAPSALIPAHCVMIALRKTLAIGLIAALYFHCVA